MQKVRRPLAILHSSKKSTHKWIRLLPKTQISLFWALLTHWDVLKKLRPVIFPNFQLYNFIQDKLQSGKSDERFEI